MNAAIVPALVEFARSTKDIAFRHRRAASDPPVGG